MPNPAQQALAGKIGEMNSGLGRTHFVFDAVEDADRQDDLAGPEKMGPDASFTPSTGVE